MKFNDRWTCWPAWVVALLVSLVAIPAGADPKSGGHAELGIGEIRTRPFAVGGGACLGLVTGASMRVAGALRVCVEGQATAGTNFPLKGNQEQADAGHQSLFTVVSGVQAGGLLGVPGAFATAGLGIGHSTISGARARLSSPDLGAVTLRDRTAPAFALGVGFAFLGTARRERLSLRCHGLLDGRSAPAYAILGCVGLAF